MPYLLSLLSGCLRRNNLILLLLVANIASACFPTSSYLAPGNNCDSVEHSIVENSHFQLLWTKSDIYTLQSESNSMIDGLLPRIYVGIQDTNFKATVSAFDLQTGNLIWQQPLALPDNFLASANNLYVGSYNKLVIHDVETGKPKKIINMPKVGTIKNIYTNGQNVYMNTGNGSWITYDINNDISEISKPLLPYVPFIVENEILYINDVDGFKALDADTSSVLWLYPNNEPIASHPLFTSDAIIVLTLTNKILALNKDTGNLLWSRDFAVLSNLATDSSHLYFLTSTGSLQVVDIKSGQELQNLDFAPAPFQVSTSSNMVGGYNIWVDSQGEVLVISLGDTCQLMAFQLKLP